MSRKKWKEKRRPLISRLKSVVLERSVVESWDITGLDPAVFGTLKAVGNSVPVPANWRQKRKCI